MKLNDTSFTDNWLDEITYLLKSNGKKDKQKKKTKKYEYQLNSK
jgi:hypothetical protein